LNCQDHQVKGFDSNRRRVVAAVLKIQTITV